MTTPESKEEMIVEAMITLSALIILSLSFQFLPNGRFPPGTILHSVFRYTWYSCMAIVALDLRKQFKEYGGGFVMAVLLGPITLLTLELLNLYGWIQKRRNRSNPEETP